MPGWRKRELRLPHGYHFQSNGHTRHKWGGGILSRIHQKIREDLTQRTEVLEIVTFEIAKTLVSSVYIPPGNDTLGQEELIEWAGKQKQPLILAGDYNAPNGSKRRDDNY